MTLKTCTRCKETKPLSDYYETYGYTDGHFTWCKICQNVVGKTWREKNRVRQATNVRSWGERNIEARRAHRRKWAAKHRQSMSIADRIHDNIRSKVWAQLKGQKRGRRVFEILGYQIEDLMMHLERQFASGMSWDNYGKWHIDHIKPRSSFLIQSLDDANLRACWSLSNLQPLWALDNYNKGTKH